MTPAKVYLEIPAPAPDSLIYHPCRPVGAGTTEKSLIRSYLTNVKCIGDYKNVVDGIENYNEDVKKSNKKLKESNDAR